MKSRRKILFYGNCQLCILSNYFEKNFSEKFEVIDPAICNMSHGFQDSKCFRVWSPQTDWKLDETCINKIHEQIKNCDVFIFQSHSGNITPPLLHTEFLQKEIVRGESICLQNFTESFYCFNEQQNFVGIIRHCLDNNLSTPQILDYVLNSNDMWYIDYINNLNTESRSLNDTWEKRDSLIYKDYITMNDFIVENYKKHYLCYMNQHPTEVYFEELIKRLLTRLEEVYDPNSINSLIINGGFLDPFGCKIFNEMFPNLQKPDYTLARNNTYNINLLPITKEDIKHIRKDYLNR